MNQVTKPTGSLCCILGHRCCRRPYILLLSFKCFTGSLPFKQRRSIFWSTRNFSQTFRPFLHGKNAKFGFTFEPTRPWVSSVSKRSNISEILK